MQQEKSGLYCIYAWECKAPVSHFRVSVAAMLHHFGLQCETSCATSCAPAKTPVQSEIHAAYDRARGHGRLICFAGPQCIYVLALLVMALCGRYGRDRLWRVARSLIELRAILSRMARRLQHWNPYMSCRYGAAQTITDMAH